MKKIAIGIVAHVDSGKTTLSEGLLYQAGEIRKLGRVDHRNAFLDTHPIERDRGITIFLKQAVFNINDTEFTLLDTPGHVDFSTEMERTLQVLDYAILVISGSEGVQSHTETLWKLLKRYEVPCFLFINKMDIAESSHRDIILNLRDKLDDGCVDFSSDFGSEAFYDNIAMCSEKLMEQYLNMGEIKESDIQEAISERCVFPCFFGSALKLSGVDEFLRGLDKYTKSINYKSDFAAKVFKISDDGNGNRLTHLKITGGTLKVKQLLDGTTSDGENWSEKVDQIRIYSGTKFHAAEQVKAGTICAVTGLGNTYPGEGLGDEENSQSALLTPVLSYKVELLSDIDLHNALSNLRKIEEEEPQLYVMWNEQLQEIHIQLMGEVQLEVLKQIVFDRFGMKIDFVRGNIAYRETIAEQTEGVGHYEPLRHYAEVHLLLQPGKRGSGIKYYNKCNEDKLDKNWQKLIMTHLKEKTHIGVLTGSPITDIKITLVAGRAHQKHTEGGDFRQATYRAVRQGLKMTKNILLEPWYEFKLEVPTDSIGRAMTDIQQMGGRFSQPENNGVDMTVISGFAPVSGMMEYQSEVSMYTKGRGRLTCLPNGYELCNNSDEVIEKIGYDSERDIENTADSVFCSHGAGFVVKWNEVRDYMHVDSGFDIDGLQKEIDVSEKRTSEYISSVVTDKELMKIFENTYGPIKRDTYSVLYTKKSHVNNNKPIKNKPKKEQGEDYLLVDGYNIIYAWDNLKEYADENLDMARHKLINILCNYQGFCKCQVILVFDAYKVKNNPGEIEKYHNINIVYTKEKETADMYIEKVSHQLSKKHRVRVATSDGLEQLIILGNGAYRVSANEFKKEVDMVEKAIREFLNK